MYPIIAIGEVIKLQVKDNFISSSLRTKLVFSKPIRLERILRLSTSQHLLNVNGVSYSTSKTILITKIE